jgi:hypothetical protein
MVLLERFEPAPPEEASIAMRADDCAVVRPMLLAIMVAVVRNGVRRSFWWVWWLGMVVGASRDGARASDLVVERRQTRREGGAR